DDLFGPFPKMTPRQFPKSGIGNDLEQIPRVEIRFAVSLSFKAEHRVRPGMNAPVDHPCKVDAQEGKARIGNRVNEMLNQISLLRFQFEILSAERDNLHPRLQAGQFGHAIAVETRAVDDEPCMKMPLRRFENASGSVLRNLFDLRIEM